MSVPSMVHRSGGSLIVRSIVSGDALYNRDDVENILDDGDDVEADDSTPGNHEDSPDAGGEHLNKELPDCKVKRNYLCVGCDFFTQNPRVYLYHLRDVHNEKVKIYECPNCLYASKHFQKLLRHTKMVHDDAPSKKISSEGPAEEEPHAAVFKCSVCTFTGKTPAMLAKHEREEHIKTKFFRCSKCTYVTHIKARYTKHVKYHSMPMIKCEMCDFRTPYKWNLDRHCKNHNGHGAFKCSACNFTADIKQSLTVHEMNHHVPPVGQAAGLGVGRRRNKVGASDTTLAEEIGQERQAQTQVNSDKVQRTEDIEDRKIPPKTPSKKIKLEPNTDSKKSDFINPEDIIHHANGKIYFKNKCKYCNFKTAWDGEMAKHEKKVHNIDRREDSKPMIKKPYRPVPNLIPIPSQNYLLKKPKIEFSDPGEPVMSQKDINDICAKSSNSVLKDFASLFGSEDVFKASTPKVPDLIPTAVYNNNYTSPKNKMTDVFKQKNASFFDSLREKLELGTQGTGNLVCSICNHESKCLTEHVKHQQSCGKEINKNHAIIPLHNISSSRCQFCRQRCKSSTDLFHHMQKCPEARKAQDSLEPKIEEESDTEGELRIDESRDETEIKPHPMENKVFVWNDIVVPMDIEVDDSNYEYTEEKIDDNVSLDLSIRTQSPLDSENSGLGHESITPNSVHHSPPPSTEKIPTHGNDISVAQHKRVFKCPHCTFWASTASRFHVHIVGHLNKKPFECSLCAYRSNWRWDITKHIKLKSVRDQAHEQAKVLMTDETGRRNYTKYNKYLTEIPVTSEQCMDTSGGCGTRPKHHDRNSSPTANKYILPKLQKTPNNNDFSPLMKTASPLRPPPPLKVADGSFLTEIVDKKRSTSEGKRTLFKCKKCNFKDASRDILLQHVKGHYQQHSLSSSHQVGASSASITTSTLASQEQASTSIVAGDLNSVAQDLSLRGTSPDRDEASVNNITGGKGSGGTAPFRCGHCNQVSNWKHVIQRHCRLKHNGDIRVISNKYGQEKIEMEELTDEPDHVDVVQNGSFKCTECPFSNDDNMEFEQHLLGHKPTEESIFKCFYCKFYVNRKADLHDHLQLHGITEPDDFLIKMTEKTNIEGEGKKFRCVTCPYVTNSKSQYKYHKQFHKPRGGQYSCSHCSYNVSRRHLLHQHLKVHGINIANHKQNGEAMYLDDITDDIEEVSSNSFKMDLQNLLDIPLVWVSKNGKFSKMFKCRYCPHVNLRKVNIQEHEKMHSIREKSHNSSKSGDVEHRCTECNYICANAGVLSSHSKVHQGLYGMVHRLVDPSRSDEEQIRELSRTIGITSTNETSNFSQDDFEELMDVEEIDSSSGTGTALYFCKECPSRFLKENEFGIHKKFHGSRLFYKCDHCTYTSREKPHLTSHSKVHTSEYQDRTKVLQGMYAISPNYPRPNTKMIKTENGEQVWIVVEKPNREMSTLCSILSKPVKSSQNVPLSGTDLFLQKSEAEQMHAAQMMKDSSPPRITDYDLTELMRGNPEFIYQPIMKNGRLKEKRYKCHMCPTAFEKREQYKIHLGLHGSNQRYQCEHCDYSVKYYANYVQHIKKHKMNADAQAARRSSDEADLEIDESIEETNNQEVPANNDDDDKQYDEEDKKVQTQIDDTVQLQTRIIEDKDSFFCSLCPYSDIKKEIIINHVNCHACVSGTSSTYTCEHCDFTVPQMNTLREHTKLHFLPSKRHQVEGFMSCDNMKLTEQDGTENRIVFEEHGSEERKFSPPLKTEVADKFNNNEGEKQFYNVQTGELVEGREFSDNQS
ncbi:zinc finger protein 208-like isoform X2 [Diorhabda carinulata]|nr:zinc finger protein 208-like isoform X2 [Diorhabda carinulata]XP_057652820.1 zinc finger protein 208-like isoform X2 [Diorhabda carinulata]XP_057652821.1 zinc finger protein 208-like isoform X2 [Diorhabda carinulata]XP_057652822.1 zinc finger protein 208-like isoform X2 [Diorhabda carinulata]XP_057652823.1 zinc finger protein 208-like isoform X2 [Diorhabda carinulata]XP_057652824.1 zinc finger protein 208-like isoform X2 [Diorhabda carinulata]